MEAPANSDLRAVAWTPFLTLIRKEIRRFMHVLGQTVLSPIISATLYLLIFGLSLGSSIATYHDFPYIAFLIPGLVMMTALNNSFQNISSSIVGSRFHGDLQDLKYIPLSSEQIAWAMSIGALVRGLTVAFVTFVISEIFYLLSRGEMLAIAHPLWLMLFLIVGCLTFAQIGLYIGFRAKNFEQLNAVGSFIILPLLYLGGVFFSISTLHPFWQQLAHLNPLFYLIHGFRYGILGVADAELSLCLGVSLTGLIVLHLLAIRSIKKGTFTRW